MKLDVLDYVILEWINVQKNESDNSFKASYDDPLYPEKYTGTGWTEREAIGQLILNMIDNMNQRLANPQ